MIDVLVNGVITDYPQSIAEYIHLKDELVNLEYHQEQLTEKGKKSFNALILCNMRPAILIVSSVNAYLSFILLLLF